MDICYAINMWLEENGFDACVELISDNGSYYNPERDCIFFNPKEKETSTAWNEYVSSLGGYIFNIPISLQVFFHELGHSETLFEISDDDYDYSRLLKEILAIEEDSISRYELDKFYYQIPIEAVATEWSVWFVNNHKKEVIELWQMLKDFL